MCVCDFWTKVTNFHVRISSNNRDFYICGVFLELTWFVDIMNSICGCCCCCFFSCFIKFIFSAIIFFCCCCCHPLKSWNSKPFLMNWASSIELNKNRLISYRCCWIDIWVFGFLHQFPFHNCASRFFPISLSKFYLILFFFEGSSPIHWQTDSVSGNRDCTSVLYNFFNFFFVCICVYIYKFNRYDRGCFWMPQDKCKTINTIKYIH